MTDCTREFSGFTEAINDGPATREELRQILLRNTHIQANWQTCTCQHCKRKRDIIDPQRLYVKEPGELI